MKLLCISLSLVAALILPCPVRAANLAFDDAANYAGTGTYIGTNGGTGFGTAFLNNGSSTAPFLGSSGQIDTNGLAFGLNGSSGGIVSRTFGPNTTGVLSPGQTFHLQLQAVVSGGSIQLELVPAQTFGTKIYLYFNVGPRPDYILSLETQVSATQVNTQTIDTGVPFSTNALTADYTQNTGGFTLALTPANGTTTTLTQASVSAPYAFNLSASNATLYFNNLAVVPEPTPAAAMTVCLLGGLGLIARHRRSHARQVKTAAG